MPKGKKKMMPSKGKRRDARSRQNKSLGRWEDRGNGVEGGFQTNDKDLKYLLQYICDFEKKIERSGHGTCLMDTFLCLLKAKAVGKEDEFAIIHAIIGERNGKPPFAHAVCYNKKTKNIYEVSNKYRNNPFALPIRTWISEGNVSNMKFYTLEEITLLSHKHKALRFYHLDGKFDEMLNRSNRVVDEQNAAAAEA
jgi:hypothetical protein